MAGCFGWRMKFGIVTPSTNTSLQPAFESMRPTGVTDHVACMHITNQPADDKEGFERMQREVDAALEGAVDRVMSCEPDYLILGTSGEAVWGGGLEPSNQARGRILERTDGVNVTRPVDALRPALDAYGVEGRITIGRAAAPLV